jgi:hypothetical protein
MMPPPNRVRTAAGGGGLGLSVRGHIKEKLEHRKVEKLQPLSPKAAGHKQPPPPGTQSPTR